MLRRTVILAFLALSLGTSVSSSQETFDPTGWETNTDYPLLGDPHAAKGGTLRINISNYPPTLRTEGPNANLATLSQIHSLIFESLVSLHPTTLEYVPMLATHWKVSKDKKKFWFRINPKARWADGTPVTAEDVVATWEFLTRKDIKDAFQNMTWGENFAKPVAESRTVVSVRTKKLNWRLFYYFGGMPIYQAREMRALTGDRYLKEYNWKHQKGTGPYEILPENIKKEHYIIVTRRKHYWGKDERWNIGVNNFDAYKYILIMDDELAFEKFKKGELDWYYVSKAQRWREECDFDKVRKGWIQKRKIYNQKPEGISGYTFNMRKPPFSDRNVRKAFSYLFNRERLIKKLFFSEYEFTDSYFPGSVWANPDNPKIRYNPRRAARYLARAGYVKRNKEGWLIGPDGKPFELTLEYGVPGWSRIHKVVKEDIERAGIKFNLKLIDYNTLMKKVGERNFTISFQAWTGLLFPNPVGSWSSEMADKPNTTNVPGFKNARVDELVERYDKTFDRAEQIRIIREVDRIIFRIHPYALGWTAGFTRVLYWNKFGHPKTYFSKVGTYYYEIPSLWWFDPAKEAALKKAMKGDKALPVGETVQRPWEGKD